MNATRELFDKVIDVAHANVGKTWAETGAMQKVCETLQTAKVDFDKPQMIIMLGDFSVGKTTLINSLIGEEVGATGIHPTTTDIHEYEWHGRLLVDTPGLNAFNKPEHQEKAFEAARRSNRAVVVINGRQPIGENVVPTLKQLENSQSEITVAINFWNHLETEQERSECMTYVQGRLEEIMPGLSVEVFPINAKSGSDPGVQQLREFLLLANGSDQKQVLAIAVMRLAVQAMGDMLAAYKTKEKQAHIIEELNLNIESLKKKVKDSNEKLSRATTRHENAENEREVLIRKLERIKMQWRQTVLAGAGVGGVGAMGFIRAGPVGAFTTILGGTAGCIYARDLAEQCELLMTQINQKKKHIGDLKEDLDACMKTLKCWKNQLTKEEDKQEQEEKAYKKKMDDLKTDEEQLLDFQKNIDKEKV